MSWPALDLLVSEANARCAALEQERYDMAMVRLKFAFAHARRSVGQRLRKDRINPARSERANHRRD